MTRGPRASVVVLTVMAACQPPQPLPVYGSAPEFALTAESGTAFSSAALKGKIWVADFIFTSCTGPCPRMSARMRALQQSTAHAGLSDVALVSFTVDPERDTPDVLAAYARRQQADPLRWRFLTGPRETLHQIKREAFKLGDVDGSLNHSTRFVLVDREGRIRGFYATTESDPVRQIVLDIRRLERS